MEKRASGNKYGSVGRYNLQLDNIKDLLPLAEGKLMHLLCVYSA